MPRVGATTERPSERGQRGRCKIIDTLLPRLTLTAPTAHVYTARPPALVQAALVAVCVRCSGCPGVGPGPATRKRIAPLALWGVARCRKEARPHNHTYHHHSRPATATHTRYHTHIHSYRGLAGLGSATAQLPCFPPLPHSFPRSVLSSL